MSKKKKKSNKINKTVSEEDFLNTLNIITKKLVYKFKFGYHDIDDMKQQAAIFALEGLKKYDYSRPLENFLWTHVRNRLFNYKRDNYQRPDKPCLTCPLYRPNNGQSDCMQFSDKLNCYAYKSWYSRNNNKKNIMTPQYIENNDPEHMYNFVNNISNKEIIDYLEKNLPSKYRETYLKLKYGTKISKNERIKLQNYIKNNIIPKLND
jgi:DNA-directed RNA polymerase specialized sigma24 family protein